MKIVLNECFGGFELPEQFCEAYELDEDEYKALRYDIDRADARLIEFLESYFAATGEKSYSGRFSKLVIEEIPDNATDWHVSEYDGEETLIYVVDGKLHWA